MNEAESVDYIQPVELQWVGDNPVSLKDDSEVNKQLYWKADVFKN